MSITQHIAKKLDLKNVDMTLLFALRMVFDRARDIVNLDNDIKDLLIYPERLEGSYRDEWSTYISRAIAKEVKIKVERDGTTSAEDYLSLIEEKVDNLVLSEDARYQHLLSLVKQAQSVSNSKTVSVFPHPLKKQLEKLSLINK